MSKRCSQIHEELQDRIATICSDLSGVLPKNPALLDIGCWDGSNLLRYAKAILGNQLHGIEIFNEKAQEARGRGIQVSETNLETTPFSYASDIFDLVVCNQVFEHLKNIFRPMDEIARVIKPGGYLVLSVPNLASFHNRMMLLAGIQPSSIRVFGPHVRGFTCREFLRFCQIGGVYEIMKIIPVGFYPFSTKGFGNLLARAFPYSCHTPIVLLRKKTQVTSFSWQQSYSAQGEQTLM